jgi:hypothetical protein
VLEDLKRFNIRALLVDEYAEITEILNDLVRRYRRQNVFIAAAAASFEPWGEEKVTEFMRRLGAALVASGVKVATGLGLGVGNALLTGAIEEVMRSGTRHVEDAVIIRPFPQAIPDQVQRARVWEEYRQSLIGLAGIAIFLFGNKRVGTDIQPSDGMRREFEIAADNGLILLPIGATGSISADLAGEFLSKGGDPRNDEVKKALATLVKPVDDLMSLVEPIASLVRRLKEGR